MAQRTWEWSDRGADKTMSHLLLYGTATDVVGVYSFRQNQKSSQIEPEKKLLLAVLIEAIAAIRSDPKTAKKKSDRADALSWIKEPPSEWPCSFENICEYLGFEPSYIRKAILKDFGTIYSTTERTKIEDMEEEPIFTNCNVCGRKLHYADEDQIGLCDNCADE